MSRKITSAVQFIYIKLGICVKASNEGGVLACHSYTYIGRVLHVNFPENILNAANIISLRQQPHYVSHHCRRAFLLATVPELDVLCCSRNLSLAKKDVESFHRHNFTGKYIYKTIKILYYYRYNALV